MNKDQKVVKLLELLPYLDNAQLEAMLAIAKRSCPASEIDCRVNLLREREGKRRTKDSNKYSPAHTPIKTATNYSTKAPHTHTPSTPSYSSYNSSYSGSSYTSYSSNSSEAEERRKQMEETEAEERRKRAAFCMGLPPWGPWD